MTVIHSDSSLSDVERRARLFAGDLFVYGPTKSSLQLVEFAWYMVNQAFGSLDPRFAQFQLQVERYAAILAALKPAFIHHPRCKELVPAILGELGCDPEHTFFDVPRMRTRPVATISARASPTRFTLTAIRGIRRRFARSTGGSRSTDVTVGNMHGVSSAVLEPSAAKHLADYNYSRVESRRRRSQPQRRSARTRYSPRPWSR